MAKAAAKAGAKKASNKLTKAGLITALADSLGETSSRKAVKATLEALNEIATKELKKNKVFASDVTTYFHDSGRLSRELLNWY